MDLTYIFIRYVTVTLKRQEDTFYKVKGKYFLTNLQNLINVNKQESCGMLKKDLLQKKF